MDELEFRERVYANPKEIAREILDASRANPAYQKILAEAVEFENALSALLNSAELPDGLAARLTAIPARDALEAAENSQSDDLAPASNVSHIQSKKQNFFQYYAVAASLVLALGVTFSLNFDNAPSAADAVFGDTVLYHIHRDLEEIDDITNGQIHTVLGLSEVNISMASAGTRLVSHDSSPSFDVRSAKPCEILPAYGSAHLVLAGSQGAVSLIVMNNPPVTVEFPIRDDRFSGIIMPMSAGNMILVGEKNEDLNQYKAMFSENVEWLSADKKILNMH